MTLCNIKSNLKARLGELWWYTIILFFTQQVGAVINAFIGLWLVPKYVPQEELGVVLPLTSISALIGLPLSILLIPFMRFLSLYMAKGEEGKVKALLWDAFALTGVTFILMLGLTRVCLPSLFLRMRVEDGSLSLLIICSATIGSLAPVFTTVLQALKKFRIISIMGILGSFLRLGTLLLVLPMRGLSGYFVGQIAPSVFSVVMTLYFLRRYFGKKLERVAYWNEDMKEILRYVGWFALFSLCSMLVVTVENFVIRHRLSAIDSAAYYMISRFSDIVISLGVISSSVLFPMMVERHTQKDDSHKDLLGQSLLLQLGGGLLFSIGMVVLAYVLFMLKQDWQVYTAYMPHLIVLCLISVMRSMTYCYAMHELALSRFGFIVPFSLFYLAEVAILYAGTGYAAFSRWIPSGLFEVIRRHNPCQFSFILLVMCASTVVILGYVMQKIVRSQKLGELGKGGIA
jgi:O-antigen/teichoic acid export membrane protein